MTERHPIGAPACNNRVSAMGSFSPPKHFYNSDDLNQLQWIFDTVWFIFETRYPHRDKGGDEYLKGSLRRKMFTFAASGLNDPEVLEANLIASISLDGYSEHL
jgi:hypothetical protein